MDPKSELETLRNMVDVTRQLAHSALKKLEGKPQAELQTRFEVNGKKLNSVYWLVPHMAWAQSNLILRSTGGSNPELSWMKLFALGKPAEEGENCGIPYEELYAGFKKVHQLSMDHLAQLDPALLGSENKINWEILGAKTMRNTIMHHIRHENNHIGQLFWLVNLHGVKTI
jgi:uncharacterized damage-inducible protein DinB